MKKILIALSLALVAILPIVGFVGCKKKSSDDEGKVNTKIVGTWKLTTAEYTLDQEDTTEYDSYIDYLDENYEDNLLNCRYVFEKDGTGRFYRDYTNESTLIAFTWRMSGTKVNITFPSSVPLLERPIDSFTYTSGKLRYDYKYDGKVDTEITSHKYTIVRTFILSKI